MYTTVLFGDKYALSIAKQLCVEPAAFYYGRGTFFSSLITFRKDIWNHFFSTWSICKCQKNGLGLPISTTKKGRAYN